ncbi:LacI family DNA-binding transcriptional regulator [Chitinivorax sp. B]|uniref:LacI family DNA-binding transcriptional regulator n=1 Tax=Chitinivorax sp. B TaxID=2502235 RepID=UPI0010F4F4C3|nr:LacI family DNA-binding transcriptional regulator [Chitinivorax sp. B]
MPPNQRHSRATGRTTLSDVAKAAGVSPITASRALRGVASVAPELVERVKAAADSLGYLPNPAARALASARSNAVVIVVPSLSNAVFIDTLEAVQRALQPEGFEVLIGNTHYSRDEEERLLRNYFTQRPSGLIVTGFDRTENARRMIETSGVPCVYMMELANATGVHCVGFSQHDAGAIVARHLIASGRKRIAYVAAQLDPRTLQRGEGFRQVLIEHQLHDPSLELLSPAPSSVAMGAQLFQDLLKRHSDIDAIFFGNDDLAQGGLLEAIRKKIEIPDRIAVVGFNDLPASAEMVPRLTTIRTPRAAIGLRASQLLLQLMQGQAPAQPVIDLGFELVVREST